MSEHMKLPELLRRLEVTYRRGDYWIHTNRVPSVARSVGSGNSRALTFNDACMFAAIDRLSELGGLPQPGECWVLQEHISAGSSTYDVHGDNLITLNLDALRSHVESRMGGRGDDATGVLR